MFLFTGVERLAFSVTWDLTPEGKIVSQWAGRSIIKSCVKLAYGHAQQIIEGSFAGLPEQEAPSVELFGYDWTEVRFPLILPKQGSTEVATETFRACVVTVAVR